MGYKNNHIFTDEVIQNIIKTVFPDKRYYFDDIHYGEEPERREVKCIGYTSSMLNNGGEYPVEVFMYDESFDITIFRDSLYLKSDGVNIDELRGRLTGMMQMAAPAFSFNDYTGEGNFMITFTFNH